LHGFGEPPFPVGGVAMALSGGHGGVG
jgi:hypothetical protein